MGDARAPSYRILKNFEEESASEDERLKRAFATLGEHLAEVSPRDSP